MNKNRDECIETHNLLQLPWLSVCFLFVDLKNLPLEEHLYTYTLEVECSELDFTEFLLIVWHDPSYEPDFVSSWFCLFPKNPNHS